jgi:hypothetical protein
VNARRLLLAGGLLGLGGVVLTLIPILAVLVVLGGVGSFLANLNSLQGARPPTTPPVATDLTHPFEWLPLVDAQGGPPNSLVMAVMAAGSGGNVFGSTYFCSNGHTAAARCSTVYHPGVLGLTGINGIAHTLGVGRGLMNIRGASINPARNIPVGVQDLSTALAGQYLIPGLTRFHATDQAPPGYTASGAYVATVRADLAQYAVPQMGVWALSGWKNGAWTDPANKPVWVFVVAAAPVGPPWSLTLGPPICASPGRGQPVKCRPDVLTGFSLEPPTAVTATLANGRTVTFTPSTAPHSGVPVWPGGLVYGAQVPFAQGITLTAYWPGTTTSLAFPNAWSTSGANGGPSGPAGTLSAAGVWRQWKTLILRASAATGVPAALLAAEIEHESGGSPTAGSPAGAYGLMQLEPSTGAAYGCTHRANPRCNVMAGARYLAALHRQFQSWRGSSAGYYGGGGFEAAALTAAGLPPPVPWSTAQGALQVVPDPQAGNTLTLAAYADAVWATAQQLATQFGLPL